MRPFEPLLANAHFQTIAGHLWPRPAADPRFPRASRLYRTEPRVEVLVESQRPVCPPRGEILMVHGLEGSSEAGYMRSFADRALQRGFGVHRFNMRTCGGTERLCNTLYHAGLTSDLLAVLEDFQRQGLAPVFLAGFSLGGNVVLKLAGELGHEAGRWISGVAAASTPIDLAACARRIQEPDNWLYERRFVAGMRRRLCATGRYVPADFDGMRSVYQIDDRITAPSFGFRDAEHYYATQSARNFLHGIRVPGLLIQAKDDTFIPFAAYENSAIRENPNIRLVVTEHGGHLGFIARRCPRFWLDETIVEWLETLI